ncbi:galactose-binding like protein [Aaosphaeria arxii CBS 175.79]|uniref:Galactose-binding like protein n=1 Tax=Aaosphaeria arxii CBS 175.79 TaxID=1450172 RepID=A0A6A5X8A4_9PLEO|nr:galactose-binding like protein [Aaosphaeria arxii CBS 175.79]KAF2008984.1 galactose-binding like protein [Aaosphaeria arxii CBS 175.79]
MPSASRWHGTDPPQPHQLRSLPNSDDEDVNNDEMVDPDTEDDQEYPGSSPHSSTGDYDAPFPPNYREISTLASWTVSSSKPGCSIPQLRSPSTHLFWQSDGPQPHYLNIHFFKLVRIVALRLFLDFDSDESYTPTRIIFLAGSGMNDLVEWGEMRLEQPRGWIWADFEGVDDESSEDESEDDEDFSEDGNNTVNGNNPNTTTSPFSPSGLTPSGRGQRQRRQRPPVDGPMAIDTPDPNMSEFQTPDRPHTDTPILPVPRFTIPPPPQNGNLQTTPILHTPQIASSSFINPSSSPEIPIPEPHDNTNKRHSPTTRKKQPVLRAHLVQIKILENHQNGKDTHLRGLQIFAKDGEADNRRRRSQVVSYPNIDVEGAEEGNGKGKGKAGKSAGRSGVDKLPLRGMQRPVWDVDPVFR